MSIENTTKWLSERAESMKDIAVRSSDPKRTASCLVEADRCENAVRLILALAAAARRSDFQDDLPLFIPVQMYDSTPEPEKLTRFDKMLDWWDDTIYSLKQRFQKKA